MLGKTSILRGEYYDPWGRETFWLAWKAARNQGLDSWMYRCDKWPD